MPKAILGLGFDDDQFNMVNWYPKPAVYDKNGWNTMGLSPIGLGYAEFGDFNVNIKINENYYIASTGILETKSERKNIERKIKNSNGFSNNDQSNNLKTIQFKATNVNDFAWFASTKFKINKETINLSDGKNIDFYLYYNQNILKQTIIDSIKHKAVHALKFY